MLKSEMQGLIQAMEDQLLDYEASQRVDRDLIKSAADKERKHTKLRRHVDKAMCAIEAIKKVNCCEELNWNMHGPDIMNQAEREGKELPAWPKPTDLYVTLNHIEEILSRSVEEHKGNNYLGSYR